MICYHKQMIPHDWNWEKNLWNTPFPFINPPRGMLLTLLLEWPEMI